MREREFWRGDFGTTIIRLDIERALQDDRTLTPRQRQCLALYYFACLNQRETAATIGISQPSVVVHLKKALEAVAAYLRGKDVKAPQVAVVKPTDSSSTSALSRWLADIAENAPGWWNVPDDVWREIRERFGLLAPEEDVGDDSGDDFPRILPKNSRQFRREILRPNVWPRYDNYGSRKGGGGMREKFVRAS